MQIFCGPDIPVPLSMWNEIPSCLRFVSLTEQGKCHSLYEGKFGVHKSVHRFLKNRFQKLICSATVWRLINLCTLILMLLLIDCLDCFSFFRPILGEFGFRNPGKFLLIKFEILGFGIRNTAQGIRNPTDNWNPESKFYWQILESSTWNPESTRWNPESKTVLDSLLWGNLFVCLFVCFFKSAIKS